MSQSLPPIVYIMKTLETNCLIHYYKQIRIRQSSKLFITRKKILLILPLSVKDRFSMILFNAKANIFNIFFAEQCTLYKKWQCTSNQLNVLTESKLCFLNFNEDKILKIIKGLNIYKAPGHKKISIRMIKICDKLLLKPLVVLFHNSVKSSCYSDIWKKYSIMFVHKKINK